MLPLNLHDHACLLAVVAAEPIRYYRAACFTNTLTRGIAKGEADKDKRCCIRLGVHGVMYTCASECATTGKGCHTPSCFNTAADLDAHLRSICAVQEKPQDVVLDLVSIARSTTGWSGADLSNLVNEAALAAVSTDTAHLTTDLLTKAMDKVIMGLPRRCVRPSVSGQQPVMIGTITMTS